MVNQDAGSPAAGTLRELLEVNLWQGREIARLRATLLIAEASMTTAPLSDPFVTSELHSPTTAAAIAAVKAHFMEWHGAAPNEREVLALLTRIDKAKFTAEAEASIRADCARNGVEPVIL